MNKKNENDQELILKRVQENWATLKGLINRIESAEIRASSNELCDDLHDRFAVAPASTKLEYVGCFVGGLVWHSLNVLRIMKNLRSSLDLERVISADSLIVLSLFHDIGKLGNEDEDYYLPQRSEWHRDKLGQLYEINEELNNVSVPIRSLWWMNRYGILLSENELYAIQSLSVRSGEQISFSPSLRDPWEAYLLQSAVRGACIKHKGITSLTQTV
jgi:hypothetical protein